MLQRTYLRVKILTFLFRKKYIEISDIKKDLIHTFAETHSLYISFYALFLISYTKLMGIKRFGFDFEELIEYNIPISYNDSKILHQYSKKYKINWDNHPDALHKIHVILHGKEKRDFSDIYAFYLSFFKKHILESNVVRYFFLEQYTQGQIDFEEMKKIFHYKMKRQNFEIFTFEDLFSENIFDFCLGILNEYENSDTELMELIEKLSPKKRIQGLNQVDIIIIKMLVCEKKVFPASSINVLMNEYLNIATDFSGPNNIRFINGLTMSLLPAFAESKK